MNAAFKERERRWRWHISIYRRPERSWQPKKKKKREKRLCRSLWWRGLALSLGLRRQMVRCIRRLKYQRRHIRSAKVYLFIYFFYFLCLVAEKVHFLYCVFRSGDGVFWWYVWYLGLSHKETVHVYWYEAIFSWSRSKQLISWSFFRLSFRTWWFCFLSFMHFLFRGVLVLDTIQWKSVNRFLLVYVLQTSKLVSPPHWGNKIVASCLILKISHHLKLKWFIKVLNSV